MPAPPPRISSDRGAVPARVGLTRDQVMTAGEVAELLHLPVSTVYYLARRGELARPPAGPDVAVSAPAARGDAPRLTGRGRGDDVRHELPAAMGPVAPDRAPPAARVRRSGFGLLGVGLLGLWLEVDPTMTGLLVIFVARRDRAARDRRRGRTRAARRPASPPSARSWRSEDPVATVRELVRESGGGVYLGLRADGDWRLSRSRAGGAAARPAALGEDERGDHPGAARAHRAGGLHLDQARRRPRDPPGTVAGSGGCGCSTRPARPAPAAEELRWSPVRASARWDGALLMARAMTAGRRGRDRDDAMGRTGPSAPRRCWRRCCTPPRSTAATWRSVVDWVMRHELDEAGILLEQERGVAAGVRVAGRAAEHRGPRARVDLLRRRRRARRPTTRSRAGGRQGPELRRRARSSPPKTRSTSTPPPRSRLPPRRSCAGCWPRSAARPTARTRNGELRSGRVLFALDEVANIAPLEELPQIASEGGGQGLTLLAAVPGPLPGPRALGAGSGRVPDPVRDEADPARDRRPPHPRGDLDRARRVRPPDRLPHPQPGSREHRWSRRRRSAARTISTQRTRVLSPGEIANIPAGHALHLDGLRWELLTLTPAHSDRAVAARSPHPRRRPASVARRTAAPSVLGRQPGRLRDILGPQHLCVECDAWVGTPAATSAMSERVAGC